METEKDSHETHMGWVNPSTANTSNLRKREDGLSMQPHTLEELKNHIAGEVIAPSSPAYDERRHIFNQTGSPAVIVCVQSNEDIATAIRFARERRLALSVRAGGHGWSGLATNNGGLVIDLTALDTVRVLDEERRIVRVGAGACWGDVARSLAPHGLALSSGDTNQVGVGGLTLGGGIGWMARTYGLTIDSLVAAEIVIADGRTLHVSEREHPDLFWAIRGGGGNFGVVTSFDFQAHPVRDIVGGSVIYDPAEAKSVLAAWAASMREAPEELNSTIVLFPGFGPQAPAQIRVLLCYAGDDEIRANAAIQPLLRLGSVQSQDIRRKPYAAMLEDAVSPPPALKLAGYGGFVKTLSDEATTALAANYGQPGKPIAQVRALGGAVARVSPEATAFAHREHEALVVVPAFAPRDASEEQTRQMSQDAWRPLAPFANGAYLNFVSDTSEETVAAVYPGDTFAHLAAVKATYDPENIFNQNQNIKPAVPSER
jgi:FAD/FMN-containing dehydrogenase